MTTLTLLPPQPVDMPLMPLRDVVVFPHMVIPLFVGRPKSIKALEAAVGGERRIALVAQRTSGKDEPAMTDLYATGCICTVLQMLKLPDGTVKVLVQGQQRLANGIVAEQMLAVARVLAGDEVHPAQHLQGPGRYVVEIADGRGHHIERSGHKNLRKSPDFNGRIGPRN